MKKQLLMKTFLVAVCMFVGTSAAWAQVSSWTYNPSGSYTGGQEIAGDVSGIATITLGNGTWSINTSSYPGIWTNGGGSTTFTDNIPTNGTYLQIVPIKTMQMVLTTGANNNYTTHVVEASKPTQNLYYNRPRYGDATTFTKLEAGKTYYFYGDGYKTSGDELRIKSYTLTSYENYTIHYVDDSATPVTIKEDRVVSGESLYGATVSAEESDLANVSYNKNTYVYKSGNTPITLSTSGNEITLVFAKATAANVKVKYTANIADVVTEIKDAVNIESAVGATVTATGENSPTYITYNDVKYKYSSGNNPLTVTGVAENDVITLVYTPAPIYSYQVNSYDGSDNKLTTIASGSYVEGDAAVSVSYPRWILSGTTLYSSGSGAVAYSTSFTPNTDDYEKKITYNSGTVNNVVFYTEGEDVVGASVGSNSARASKGKMGYTANAQTYIDATILTPGRYQIYMRSQNGNSASRAYNFKVGENVIYNGSFGNGTNTDSNSEEFTVNENSTLSFASVGSSASGIDYFYVVKTGDATVTKTITSAGWATYCSPYALNLAGASATLEDAYIVTGGNDGVLKLTSVKGGTVPANTGLLLKGSEGTVTISIVGSSTTDVSANKLVGVTAATPLAAEDGYVLMGSPSVGFYKNAKEFTVGANTAYLPADFVATARSFYSFGDATAIKAIDNSRFAIDNYYNVAGQRVAAPTKGLYIKNGKKIVVK